MAAAAAACRRVMVVLPSPGARAAPVAPLEYIRKIIPSYNQPISFSLFLEIEVDNNYVNIIVDLLLSEISFYQTVYENFRK